MPTRTDASSGTPPETEESPSTPKIPPLDGSWDSYRHDAANTAASDDPGPREEPSELWSRRVGLGRPAVSPAATNGVVVAVTESGLVVGRDAADGTLRWRRSLDVEMGVAPVATAGTVVLAGTDETLVGLRSDDGTRRWRTELAGRVLGFTATADTVIATTETEIVAVALSDGRERWRYSLDETDAGGQITTAPGGGGAVTAVGLSGGAVLAVDANGERRFRTAGGGPVTTRPAVAGGQIYVESGSRVAALDAASGASLWEYDAEHEIVTPLAVTGDAVVLATLDPDATPSETEPGTPPPTDVEFLYGSVTALSPADGSVVWRTGLRDTYSFTSGPPERASFVVLEARVLLEFGGTVRAFDSATGEALWQTGSRGVTPAVTEGIASTGTAGFDAADGSLVWEVGSGGEITASAAVVDNSVYVGSHDHSLYALAANSGEIEWIAPMDGEIHETPAVGDDAVYVGTTNGTLYAVSREDGRELWRTRLGGPIQSPTLADGSSSDGASSGSTLYVGNFSETLFAVDTADGTVRWRAAGDGYFLPRTPAVADGTVFAGANGDLRAFDAKDGTELWRVSRGDQRLVQSTPAVADGRVFLNLGRNLVAFDAEDGTELWSRATGGSNEPPAVHDGTVYAVSDGTVFAFAVSDGSQQWRRSVGRNAGIVAGGEAVYALGFDTPLIALAHEDGTELWREPAAEAVALPAIAGEYLFFGETTGVVRAIGTIPE
jgi:outer membrane protein assembly factor BamB